MRRTRTGFTLIELLVVIAVVAILAAILFPVYHLAKGIAHRAKCASNLRQLGAAFSMYVADWNGAYPSPGGLTGDWNYWSQSSPGGLNKYVSSRGGFNSVWCCPLLTKGEFPYAARSYSMNSFLRNPADVSYPTSIHILDPIKQDRIQSLPRTILVYEGIEHVTAVTTDSGERVLGTNVYRCADWTEVKGWYEGPASGTRDANIPSHGSVNNYLYCDGHVRARPPGKHLSGVTPNVSWEEAKEWFVDKQKYRHMWR